MILPLRIGSIVSTIPRYNHRPLCTEAKISHQTAYKISSDISCVNFSLLKVEYFNLDDKGKKTVSL